MFEQREQSRFTGEPIWLFVFTRQSLVWRYCTADRDLVIGGQTYKSAQITRSEIKQTAERAKDKITITLAYLRDPTAKKYPVTQPLGDNWFPYVPSSTVYVTCLATHYGDTDPPAVEWMGQVTQPKFGDVELELTCEPTGGTDRARNQGAKWQRGCWKTVYSTGLRGCNLIAGPIPVAGTLTAVSGADITAASFVSQARTFVGGTATWQTPEEVEGEGPVQHTAAIIAHSGTTLTLDDATGLAVDSQVIAYTVPLWTEATLTDVDGLTLTAPEFAGAPLNLAGGSLTWTNVDGLVERRSIMSHSGDEIAILYGSSDLEAGLPVIAVPGCPRTWAACDARGNTVHYGGAIYKPGKNPTEDSMSWG
ncbi:DUF2163 domain-containing protein [Stenotrophomonas maltophilia]|nr:DUF2163 domain-containing protein [Stenotrophomonas maltophilia]HEL4296638.1 DUF2163 domain-containing protein [Stenotrophomonas maltophilia]